MTKIEWISVKESLPKDEKTVLGIIQGDDNVYSMSFDSSFGWIPKTLKHDPMMAPNSFRVSHWSEYSIPE